MLKPRILTLTPNPALDLGGMVKKIVPNEKIYVHHPTLHPGGNGINAARIAHRLGAPVTASGFIAGGTGEEIMRALDEEALPHRFVKVGGMTRINVTVTTENTPRQTRLSFPGPEITRAQAMELKKSIQALRPPSLVVIGGSLPPGYSSEQVSALIKDCRKQGLPCLVDIPGAPLSRVLSSRPFFIKPNLAEFQELTGSRTSKLSSVLAVARKLNRQVPLICVSSVEGGAILVSSQGAWYGRTPAIPIRSTVGAGDSMVGAIAFRLSRQLRAGLTHLENSLDDALLTDLLSWGLAAACATLTRTGTHLGIKSDIIRFQPRITLKKLK